MKLLTPIRISKSEFSIHYSNAVLSLGSCFAENIAAQMKIMKFRVLSNPAGVLYNPVSVARCLQYMVNRTVFKIDQLEFSDELYFHYDFHGSFSSQHAGHCIGNINQSIQKAHQHLLQTDWLIVSFGTAGVFELKPEARIVANCHKQSASNFTERILEIEEIVNLWRGVLESLQTIRPQLRVVFTISPVRYLKNDTMYNSLSKSILFLAVQRLVEQHDNCEYFPAYELLIDELRDYRFYADDMIHPSSLAVEYIYRKFADCYYARETLQLHNDIDSLVIACRHRPRNAGTTAYRNFCEKILAKIDIIEAQHPYIDFSEERAILQGND